VQPTKKNVLPGVEPANGEVAWCYLAPRQMARPARRADPMGQNRGQRVSMNDPVTMRRQLRVELKRLRSGREFTQRYVAEELDWSQSKIIRIENGTVAIGVTDLRALLELYGVTDQDAIANLVAMARGSKRQPFVEYKDIFRPDTLRYFAYESSASLIRQVEPLVVPGMLQTEEYARALLQSYDLPQTRIGKIWESREERQELLDRPEPPKMFFILDEGTVRRTIGGPGVMRRQLDHLIELSKRPQVAIQVLQFTAGAHRGLRGPFVYLEFPDADDPDVLYLENSTGDAVFRDDTEFTGPYLEDFFLLEAQATDPERLEEVLHLSAA
jgi:transcriptional regulator with XRE-family HTH domain